MKPINLNQISNEYIIRTKAGKLWRCGKGYRKNWSKLIGKLVLLHNAPYTLINRIKEGGKWYLVFTDGTNNYTERQDKALHNKKLAKDTIVEAVKRVIAGLLPAPMELIDRLVEQANTQIKLYNSIHSDSMESTWEQTVQESDPTWLSNPLNLFEVKLELIAGGIAVGLPNAMSIYRQLVQYYHPDHNNNSCTEIFELIGVFRHMI